MRQLAMAERIKRVVWAICLALLVVAVWRLETERATVHTEVLATQTGPVTLMRAPDVEDGPLVVVTHGFAGSSQMMQYISRDLARAGFTVATFDFFGQGRSAARMSSDVTRIEGTTRQLVEQTLTVIDAVQDSTAPRAQAALVGHSMATDIIIRAAEQRQDIAAIVAISMYSDAVSPQFPQRLLILSGAWEERLRVHGREAVAMVGGEAVEAVTVQNATALRRAVAVPKTEHVAVLFAALTLEETRAWIGQAFGMQTSIDTQPRGLEILMALGALVVLVWPAARVLPMQAPHYEPLGWKPFLAAVVLPAAPALAATLLVPGGLFGSAGFGSLTLFFAVWGIVALGILLRAGRRPGRPHLAGTAFLIVWGLGLFAVAMDRYAASFMPFGPRMGLMLALLAGTVPFMLADRLLIAGGPLWQRVLARAFPVAALSITMVVHPQNMGLLFTVLPVMVLFYAVYGTMGRAVALRAGPETAAVGQAVILAWAIAASTPLFAV